MYSNISVLSLGGCKTDIVQSMKVLGVIFKEYMCWDATVECIARKLSQTVGLIYKFYVLPRSGTTIAYYSLFYSC